MGGDKENREPGVSAKPAYYAAGLDSVVEARRLEFAGISSHYA